MNREKIISKKELKYFSYSFKNASCLGKMHLLPKIRKRLGKILGRSVKSIVTPRLSKSQNLRIIISNRLWNHGTMNISHDAVLNTICEKLGKRSDKKVPSADLVDMAGFVLRTISLNLIQKSSNKSLVLP